MGMVAVVTFCEGCLLVIRSLFRELAALGTGVGSGWDAGWLVACRLAEIRVGGRGDWGLRIDSR
jgi:hypothetical protein